MLVPHHPDEKKLSGSTALVTGAGGFIGSHLVERLVSLGCKVKAFLRYTSRQQPGLLSMLTPDQLQSVEFIYGDLLNETLLANAAQNCDYIFHLGALIGIPYSYVAPRSYVDVNITGSLNVLLAAQAAGVKRVIQTSTSEVYGTAQYAPMDETHPLRPQSPYAASKVGSDQLALSFHLSYDVPVVVLRPFNTYGPRQSLRAVIPTVCLQALRGETLTLGNLNSERDFTYVEDTCKGFILAACRDNVLGRTINLGVGSCISIRELVDQVGRIVGRPLKTQSDKERMRPPESEVEKLISGNQLASELLDWRPEIEIETGLKRVLEWVDREHGANSATYAV